MFDINTNVDQYASIVVTHECNMSCKFCIDSYRGRKEYITWENVKKAVEVFKQKNVQDVLIVGGEPTLHPDIYDICKFVKNSGFNVIFTTNYTNPDIIMSLDGIVDSFNISFYNQAQLPKQSEMVSDLTISALIHSKQLQTKNLLDDFIDTYLESAHLKFSTLSACNQWTREHQSVPYLDELLGERFVLFDEIEGVLYRGCIIKRYDRILNNNAKQSLKFHVDGKHSYSWERI